MNQQVAATHTLPTFGAPVAGGFVAGVIQLPTMKVGIVVAPKSAEFDGKWLPTYTNVDGARSSADGYSNTIAMAAAGSEIAKRALELRIGDHSDWYIPSRDELELIYRNLKPGDDENLCGFRDGDNPCSEPCGLMYTEQLPAQTDVEAFRTGGAEAMQERWYWSSTQYSANYAFIQYFADGYQFTDSKGNEYLVRPVRRFIIDSAL